MENSVEQNVNRIVSRANHLEKQSNFFFEKKKLTFANVSYKIKFVSKPNLRHVLVRFQLINNL